MTQTKLLTIAIPTYNRSSFVITNIQKILSEIKLYEDTVTLLVSDNCSSDDTEARIKELISYGAPIDYFRQHTNIGMDGNFVYCLQNAKSRYVWLLGDDDYLIDGALAKLLFILENEDYGLVHLTNKRDAMGDTSVFSNPIKFAKAVSFNITFISGNIVNINSFVNINFTKYKNSLLSHVPAYFYGILNAERNAIVEFPVLLAPADSINNGGYNIFEVFVSNYLKILKEFRPYLGIIWFEIEKYKLCRGFLLGWMFNLLTVKEHGLKFKTDNWFPTLFKAYWYEPYFYMVLLVVVKRKIFNKK